MANGIRVSEKFGVNPTLCVCFWCGGETGDLALLGRLKGDVEAARQSVINYEPCKDCKEKMGRGIALLEVEPVAESSNPPINKGCDHSFTGRFFVISENLAGQLFTKGGLIEQMYEQRKAFLPPEVFKLILRKLSDAGLVSE